MDTTFSEHMTLLDHFTGPTDSGKLPIKRDIHGHKDLRLGYNVYPIVFYKLKR